MKHGEHKESKGLLNDFLQQKARSYVPPARVGTPRGQSVGFSREKYLAALFTVTSIDQQKLAQRVGVSYGVLRKWRTESDFKKTVAGLCKEYAALFFGHIKTRVMAHRKDTEEILKLPGSAIAETKLIEAQSYDEFADGKFYGDLLILRLWKDYIAKERVSKTKSADDIMFYNETLWIFDWIAKSKGKPTPYMDLVRTYKERVFNSTIKNAINLLVSPKPTSEQRTTAIFLLTCIARASEQARPIRNKTRRPTGGLNRG
jgi:hypothetical protein